jgi:hypothetical protein
MKIMNESLARSVLSVLEYEVKHWKDEGFKPLPTKYSTRAVEAWSGVRYPWGLAARTEALAWLRNALNPK